MFSLVDFVLTIGFFMNKIVSIFLSVSLFSGVFAMQDDTYDFRLATQDDISSVVKVINTEAYMEKNIVTPPKKFMPNYIEQLVQKGRLFIVADSKEVVAYKKLFVMDDPAERGGVLNDEIRCNSIPTYSGTILYENDALKFQEGTNNACPSAITYIYNGGDYTKKENRGKGLNTKLMHYALKVIKNKTIENINTEKSKELALVYGITAANGAFNLGDPEKDRTYSIAKAFIPFAQGVSEEFADSKGAPHVTHQRYEAYMPSFAADSDTFKPLDDEYSLEGKGVVLQYPLCGPNKK